MANTLREDREILRRFSENSTPQFNFNPEYEYTWEYVGANGRYIWNAQAIGWQPVHGDMDENPGIRDAAGNCVIGDTMLMRMPKQRHDGLRDAKRSLDREARGELSEEATRAEIDARISRLIGSDVKIAFEFRDRRELAARQG